MRSLYHEDNVPPSVAPSKTRLSEEFLHSDTTTNEKRLLNEKLLEFVLKPSNRYMYAEYICILLIKSN